jgi:hypothetical protein
MADEVRFFEVTSMGGSVEHPDGEWQPREWRGCNFDNFIQGIAPIHWGKSKRSMDRENRIAEVSWFDAVEIVFRYPETPSAAKRPPCSRTTWRPW